MSFLPSRVAGVVVLTAIVAAARPALAQPSSETQAAAEDLFQRGKQRFAAKDWSGACTLFAESYRLDPAGGTLQNLGVCYEEVGKWASAQATFEELRSLSRTSNPPRPDRVKVAEEHLEKLAPKVARIVIVADDAPKNLVVKLDGKVRAPISWAEGIVVDPGTHSLEARAPRKLPFVAQVDVGPSDDGARKTVRIPPLTDPPPTPELAGERNEPPPGRDGEAAPTAANRTAGIIVGSAGVVTLGAGVVFGVLAGQAKTGSRDLCSRSGNPGAPATDFDPSSGRCFEGTQAFRDASDKTSEARRDANVANVLVPLGAIAIGVGVYLILHRTSRARAVAPGNAPGNATEVRF